MIIGGFVRKQSSAICYLKLFKGCQDTMTILIMSLLIKTLFKIAIFIALNMNLLKTDFTFNSK